MCLTASAHMVVHYLHGSFRFPSPPPSFDYLCEILPSSDILLGTPPNKIRDYLKRIEEIGGNLKVRHLKGQDISTLEFRVRQRTPPIALFDLMYYHTRSPLSRSSHATVIVGYTDEVLYANNPVYGADYPYEKKRFKEAWERRGMKYILITPKESLVRYLGII